MIFVITGSSKGIGRNLTEHYLTDNNTVIGISRTESNLNHKNYRHYSCNITNEKEVKNAQENIRKEFGYIDILINNAGIASMNHSLLTPTNTVKNIIETNFIGTFIMLREFSRMMKGSSNPRIINFSTIAKPLELEGESAYISSKAAVESFTKVTAKELAQFNITVNALGPTPIKTDLIAGIPEEKIASLVGRQSIKRMGRIEDIINVIDFFIRPESNFITGQVIYLGGIS